MSNPKNTSVKTGDQARVANLKTLTRKVVDTQLLWILTISGIVRLIYYSALLTTTAVDTATYVNYHANILLGQTDGLRTPLYPYFIKLVGLFGQSHLLHHVVIAQIIISFLSIIVFYEIVSTVFKIRSVIFSASLLYGAMLPVINFDKLVLTESLAVTFSPLFIYLILSYLQKPRHAKAWLLTLFTFIAIMLRPSFIYLLPFAVVFWIVRLLVFKRDWKMSLSGLFAAVVCMALINGYSHLNKNNSGFNGISVVSNNNQMDVIVKANLYYNGNDPAITAAIINNLKMQQQQAKGTAGINIMVNFEPNRVNKFITTCIKNQPLAYAEAMGGKLLDLQTTNIFTNYAEHKLNFLAFRIENIEYLIFCVTFNILYFFLLVSAIWIIYRWVKGKQTPWFKLVLWSLISLQLAVTIMGGYSEYQRLLLPAMPALIILLFYFADMICHSINADKLEKYPASV